MSPKIVKIGLTLLMATTIHSFVSAQAGEDSLKVNGSQNAKVYMVSAAIGGLQPSGAFKKKIQDMQTQFNLSGFGQVKAESPLFAGFELGYSNLQRYGTTLPFIVDGITEDWSVETKSQILYMEISTRYYFPFKIYTLDFFSEFGIGTNILFTTTAFTPPNSEEASETDTDKSSVTLRYGAGLGFHLPIYEMIYIQGRVNYAGGLSTQYYGLKDRIEPIVDSTIEAFELQKSTTDILKWDIGLTFAF